MADVMSAFLGGRQAAQAEAAHEQALEENKLRAMVLKHQLSAIKLDDAQRADQIKLGRAAMGIGQEGDQPTTPAAPAPSAAPTAPSAPAVASPAAVSPSPAAEPSIVPGVLERARASFGGAQVGPQASEDVPLPPPQDPWAIGATPKPPPPPAPVPAAAAAAPAPRQPPKDRIWLDPISVPELGINQPGQWYSPSLAQAAQDRRAVALKRGERPAHVVNPGDALADVDETGNYHKVFENENAPNNEFGQFQQAYAEGLGAKSFKDLDPKQKAGVFPAYAQARQDPEVMDLRRQGAEMNNVYKNFLMSHAADLAEERHQREQQALQIKEWTASKATAAKAHAAAVKAWSGDYLNLMKPEAERTPMPEPPEAMTQTFDEWQAAHPPKAAAPTAGTPGKPGTTKVTQPTNPLHAADPKTGQVFVFGSKEDADKYRAFKGLK